MWQIFIASIAATLQVEYSEAPADKIFPSTSLSFKTVSPYIWKAISQTWFQDTPLFFPVFLSSWWKLNCYCPTAFQSTAKHLKNYGLNQCKLRWALIWVQETPIKMSPPFLLPPHSLSILQTLLLTWLKKGTVSSQTDFDKLSLSI